MGNSHANSSHAPAEGHDAHAHDVQAHVRKYLMVFGALLVGTIITVGMYYVYLPSVALTVVVALFIATIKASLVACYFMHLIDERRLVYNILLATVFFFAGMMALTLISLKDPPSQTTEHVYKVTADKPAGGASH